MIENNIRRMTENCTCNHKIWNREYSDEQEDLYDLKLNCLKQSNNHVPHIDDICDCYNCRYLRVMMMIKDTVNIH